MKSRIKIFIVFIAVVSLFVLLTILFNNKRNIVKSNTRYEQFSVIATESETESEIGESEDEYETEESIVDDTSTEFIPPTVSTTKFAEEYYNTPKEAEVLEADGITVIIDEEARGFNEESMLRGAYDYCVENDIHGEVHVIDSDVLPDGRFQVDIKTNKGTFTIQFDR